MISPRNHPSSATDPKKQTNKRTASPYFLRPVRPILIESAQQKNKRASKNIDGFDEREKKRNKRRGQSKRRNPKAKKKNKKKENKTSERERERERERKK